MAPSLMDGIFGLVNQPNCSKLNARNHLNSRVGTPIYDRFAYKENPDKIVNANGRNLLKLLEEYNEMFIVNGIDHGSAMYDSEFTFFRGKVQSQNDVCITNSLDEIKEFRILPKLIESDHCPCAISMKAKINPDLRIVDECARNFCRYDHYDVNKRILKPIRFERVNTAKLHEDLDVLATELMTDIHNNKENDFVCNKLTNSLYRLCVQNYENDRTIDTNVNDIPNFTTCSSKNFRAIAEANFECFQMHLAAAQDPEKIEFYREKWIQYEQITVRKENEEYNTKVNQKWSKCKKDAKELWRMIDWKGNVQEDSQNELSYHEIYQFFESIFQ